MTDLYVIIEYKYQVVCSMYVYAYAYIFHTNVLRVSEYHGSMICISIYEYIYFTQERREKKGKGGSTTVDE